MKIIITENQKDKIRNFITKKIREKYDVGLDGMNGLPSFFNKSDDSYTSISTVIEDMKETYGRNLWKLIGDVVLDILEDKENYDFDEFLIESLSPKTRLGILKRLQKYYSGITKHKPDIGESSIYYVFNGKKLSSIIMKVYMMDFIREYLTGYTDVRDDITERYLIINQFLNNIPIEENINENLSPKLKDKLLEKLISNFNNIKKYNDYYIYNNIRYDKDQLVYTILKYFIDLIGSPKDIPEFKERREIIRNYLNTLPISGNINEEISEKLKNKLLNKIQNRFNSIKHNGTYYEFENTGYFRYEIALYIYKYISDLIGYQNALSDIHVIRKLVNDFLNSIPITYPNIDEQFEFKRKEKILDSLRKRFQKSKFKTDSGTIHYRVIDLRTGDSMFPYEFRNHLNDLIGDIEYTNEIYDTFFS